MSRWRRLSPRGGLEDFLAYWREPTPYRWQILGVSVTLTFTLMVILIPEPQRAPPPRPQVTYISTFEPGRTDEQITASNIENQKYQDELRAQRAAVEERKKDLYRALGRASGMDVDAIDERLERERAAEEAERAAAAPVEREQARTTSAE